MTTVREAAKPIRVQIRRTKGWRMPPNTVKVDRSSLFGNPFAVSTGSVWEPGEGWRRRFFVDGVHIFASKSEAAQTAVSAFRAWVEHPANRNWKERAIVGLRGKNLACWCPLDQPCHADVLLEIAAASQPETGAK